MKSITKSLLPFILIFYSNCILSQAPADCIDAIISCGNSDISLDINGIGTQELNGLNTCSGEENNSIWLSVTTITNGTLGFTLTPNSSDINEDYDFFIFGPNVTCSNLGQAIRCSTTNPSSAGLSNNLTGLRETETDTSEGPDSNGNSFLKSLDVLANQTYFIAIDRPIGNSSFNIEWTGTATLSEPPSNDAIISGIDLNLEKCDDELTTSPDGFIDFNLTENTIPIIGNQTNITVTYHRSISDAIIGFNPIPNPSTYRNISNPQTIHARITNNISGCYELTEFQLSVNLGPNFAIPTDFVLCDNLDDGNNQNGKTTFDLSTKNNEILNGQNSTDFNITYHSSLIHAENGTDPLPILHYNDTAFNEVVFVRIEDVLNSNCKSITTLNLIINTPPQSFNYTLIQCDEDGLFDGLTTYNLNEANGFVTDIITGKTVKYYTDVARTIEIEDDSSAFNNTLQLQTIYLEIIDNATNCISNSEIILDVATTDANNAILTACDDDGIIDGLHTFNLNDANNQILNGFANNLTIAYYASFFDSILERDPLNSNFTTTSPDSQIIYARVENDNACFGISQIFLSVGKIPDIKTEDLFYYCLNDFPNTITIDAAVLNDSPSNFTYNWSTNEDTYDIQINTPGNYTVTVTNTNNNCFNIRSVVVEASNIATFNIPAFDIIDASENNTITVFVTGEGTYQYSLVDEHNSTIKPYQDNNLFENVFPGIYTVLVKDIKNDCGIIEEIVSVIGFPKFFTPNNDGVNDTWQMYGISSMIQPNTKIQIFNRFGKLIKEINPLSRGWDGTLNGKKLHSDDYWFSVKLQDGRVFNNHFSLKN